MSVNFGLKHPEKAKDEVFVTNASTKDFHKHVGWRTKRRGTNAYTINGELINNSYSEFAPVFVKYKELLEAGFVRKNDGSFEENPKKAEQILPIFSNVIKNNAASRKARMASKFTCG